MAQSMNQENTLPSIDEVGLEDFTLRGRIIAMVIRVLTLVLIITSLFYSTDGVFVVALLFVLVVPFEKLFPRHKGQRLRRKNLSTDIGYALISPLMAIVTAAVAIFIAIISLAWIPGLLIRPYVQQIPTDWMPIIGFLLFDFLVYWTHRFYHEIPVIWKFHAIHHSTEELDWASGFRAHPLDGTIIAPAFAFLIAAGFSPEITGILAVVQILLGLFLHANVRWELKWLQKVVITPEFHHWHHTSEKEAIWTNYSTFLPIWDIIFGTYYMPKNKRPKKYGVNEEIPDGILAQLKHPLATFRNPFWYFLHPVNSIKKFLSFVKILLRSMWVSLRRKRGTKPWDIYSSESSLDY